MTNTPQLQELTAQELQEAISRAKSDKAFNKQAMLNDLDKLYPLTSEVLQVIEQDRLTKQRDKPSAKLRVAIAKHKRATRKPWLRPLGSTNKLSIGQVVGFISYATEYDKEVYKVSNKLLTFVDDCFID